MRELRERGKEGKGPGVKKKKEEGMRRDGDRNVVEGGRKNLFVGEGEKQETDEQMNPGTRDGGKGVKGIGWKGGRENQGVNGKESRNGSEEEAGQSGSGIVQRVGGKNDTVKGGDEETAGRGDRKRNRVEGGSEDKRKRIRNEDQDCPD